MPPKKSPKKTPKSADKKRGKSSNKSISSSGVASQQVMSRVATYKLPEFKTRLSDTNDNFDTWESRVEDWLYAIDAQIFVDASKKKNFEADLTEDETDEYDEAVGKGLDRTAWQSITASVGDGIYRKIMRKKMARGDVPRLLHAIKEQFYESSMSGRTALTQKLEKVKLEDYSDVQEYYGDVEDITKRLAGMGRSYDDEEIVYRMLEGLTSEYNPVVVSLRANKVTDVEVVKTQLKDFASSSLNTNITGSIGKHGDRQSKDKVHKAEDREVCNNYRK